jgi:hypothetical protein
MWYLLHDRFFSTDNGGFVASDLLGEIKFITVTQTGEFMI